jgi:hypothetical protein
MTFFMTSEEYNDVMKTTTVGLISDELITSTVSSLESDGQEDHYSFSLLSYTDDLYIEVSIASPKLYSAGCNEAEAAEVTLVLLTTSTTVASLTTTASSGSVTMRAKELAKGTYYVKSFVNSNNDDQYTLNVVTTQSLNLVNADVGDMEDEEDEEEIEDVIVDDNEDDEVVEDDDEEEVVDDGDNEEVVDDGDNEEVVDDDDDEEIIEDPIVEDPIVPVVVEEEDPNYVCVPVAATCQTIIERLHAGPDDWQSIEGSSEKFIDYNFQTCDQLYFEEYNGWKAYTVQQYMDMGYYEWARLWDEPSVVSMGGSEGWGYNDINQGMIGDCYYHAALAGLQEQYPTLTNQMVLTDDVNENGIYAVQFFVMGYRTVYTVDDYFPISWWGDLGMAKISEDGGVWNPIMEKAAAKMFGTYDNIASGSSSAAIYWLTGMPGSQYSTNPSNPQSTKDHLAWAIVDHTFVTVAGSHGSSDSQLSANGVVLNHAYNVFGMQDI